MSQRRQFGRRPISGLVRRFPPGDSILHFRQHRLQLGQLLFRLINFLLHLLELCPRHVSGRHVRLRFGCAGDRLRSRVIQLALGGLGLPEDPNYRILARQRSRFTHYYFYLRDETLGPMMMRVASFFPFQTTYYLNGHSFIEQELKRAQIGFRKTDNAFLAVADVAALQAAADKLSPAIIRKRLDYWTLILGPKFSANERKQLNLSRFYAIAQIEYCRNFIFKRNFPIHKLFERSCEFGLWRLTADKIAEIFGTRLNRTMRGKLATVIDRIEHGHHAFRAYFEHPFLKQYEKFSTFLRNELVSNNLADFRLKKGLDHLDAVRERFQTITARFAGFQAQWLNVHVDFPLLQRLALPTTVGAVRYPGIKIHEPRVIRLLEVLLHGGSHVGGWTAKQIHRAVLMTRAARFPLR